MAGMAGMERQDRMASMNRRAKQVVFFFGTMLAMGLADRAFAESAEEQAVLAPIHAMFDGMSKRDAAAIKAPTLAGGTMVLMRDGKPAQMTFGARRQARYDTNRRTHPRSAGPDR
jgi:hypothetical protein